MIKAPLHVYTAQVFDMGDANLGVTCRWAT